MTPSTTLALLQAEMGSVVKSMSDLVKVKEEDQITPVGKRVWWSGCCQGATGCFGEYPTWPEASTTGSGINVEVTIPVGKDAGDYGEVVDWEVGGFWASKICYDETYAGRDVVTPERYGSGWVCGWESWYHTWPVYIQFDHSCFDNQRSECWSTFPRDTAVGCFERNPLWNSRFQKDPGPCSFQYAHHEQGDEKRSLASKWASVWLGWWKGISVSSKGLLTLCHQWGLENGYPIDDGCIGKVGQSCEWDDRSWCQSREIVET